jgi:hypothetical protein
MLKDKLNKLITHESKVYLASLYECSLVSWDYELQQGDLKSETSDLPTDGMISVPYYPGVAGVKVDFSSINDVRCLVGFINRDQSKPFIAHWLSGDAYTIVFNSESVHIGGTYINNPIALGRQTEKRLTDIENKLNELILSFNLHVHSSSGVPIDPITVVSSLIPSSSVLSETGFLEG